MERVSIRKGGNRMRMIINEGIRQDASFLREQSKSVGQLNKEWELYRYRIIVLKRGVFVRVKEIQ